MLRTRFFHKIIILLPTKIPIFFKNISNTHHTPQCLFYNNYFIIHFFCMLFVFSYLFLFVWLYFHSIDSPNPAYTKKKQCIKAKVWIEYVLNLESNVKNYDFCWLNDVCKEKKKKEFEIFKRKKYIFGGQLNPSEYIFRRFLIDFCLCFFGWFLVN